MQTGACRHKTAERQNHLGGNRRKDIFHGNQNQDADISKTVDHIQDYVLQAFSVPAAPHRFETCGVFPSLLRVTESLLFPSSCILCTAAPLHDPFFRQNFPLFTIPSDFLCFVFIFSSEKLYLMYTFWSQFFRILISSTTKETNTNLHRFSINFNQETAKHPWKHVSNANLSNR